MDSRLQLPEYIVIVQNSLQWNDNDAVVALLPTFEAADQFIESKGDIREAYEIIRYRRNSDGTLTQFDEIYYPKELPTSEPGVAADAKPGADGGELSMRIRLATPADAPALSLLKMLTFKQTFVDAAPLGFGVPYPPADLATFERESYGTAAIAKDLREGDRTKTWLAIDVDGSFLGYAKAGPNSLPHPAAQPGDGELKQLYILRAAQGRGVGSALMSVAMEYLEANFTDPGKLWVGVWSGNLKAQKFYAAYGFGKVGEYGYPVGAHVDHEFIMRRD